MGCFDTLLFTCPKCGKKDAIYEQLKPDIYGMETFRDKEIPDPLILMCKDDEFVCSECSTWFRLKVKSKIEWKLVKMRNQNG